MQNPIPNALYRDVDGTIYRVKLVTNHTIYRGCSDRHDFAVNSENNSFVTVYKWGDRLWGICDKLGILNEFYVVYQAIEHEDAKNWATPLRLWSDRFVLVEGAPAETDETNFVNS